MIGLIQRGTYKAGRGWCLVGGAVLRDEPLVAAVRRHVQATLGSGMVLQPSTLQLHEVIEYFTNPDLGEFHDPRKHAVALTYSARADGIPSAQGEALAFQGFPQDQLAAIQFGFRQGTVVNRMLEDLGQEKKYDTT